MFVHAFELHFKFLSGLVHSVSNAEYFARIYCSEYFDLHFECPRNCKGRLTGSDCSKGTGVNLSCCFRLERCPAQFVITH